MIFNNQLLLVLVLALVKLNYSSPIQTNCTSVESIDGSLGVECTRNKQPDDTFEPTIIQEHFVDLFNRAKRDTNEAVISNQVSDLFIQNLAIMNEANMSDCMARVNCEEKCDYVTRGIFRDTGVEESLEGEEELPHFVRHFYEAGKRGIELAKIDSCGNCMSLYTKCNKMQYDYTVRTNALYKELIRKNVSLYEKDTNGVKIPEEIEYLHHSMRFLDLANLTQCYARVSCESTCRHYKESPNTEAPPQTSPFLQNDPQKPASVDIIHDGSILGYNLAHNGLCNDCADHYTECPPDKYAIAHSSSIIFG